MFKINENCLNQNIFDKSIEPNCYKYVGLDKLEKKIDNILKYKIGVEKFYICGYTVNNNNLYPFLNFLLKNDIKTNKLVFPFYKPDVLTYDIISKITDLLNSLFYNIILDDKYEYKGLYYYKNNIYLFFDFTNCKLIINNIYKNSIIWSTLIDEIINKKNICNIKINLDVIDFFNKNMDFAILKDKHDQIYEIPSVVYVGKEIAKINFTYIFGVEKPDNAMLFGAYYYFTNFNNAIKQAQLYKVNDNKHIKCGIVRFALFTGLTKVILNNTSDYIDKSSIKREISRTNKENNLYENLTLRISDYDGKWSENFDSIYVGDIKLDNGEKMKNTPIYVVKKYEQHTPLSYHFVNETLLYDNFDQNKDYEII